jgi:hypothetical protein
VFIFIWGWRSKILALGPAGTLACGPCERPRPFQLVLQYRYFHLYWLLRAVTKRHYLQLCTICSRGPEMDRMQIETRLGGDPVPALDRYGLYAGLAVVGLIISAAALGLI